MSDDVYQRAVQERDALRARLAELERRLHVDPPASPNEWLRDVMTTRRTTGHAGRVARRLGFIPPDDDGATGAPPASPPMSDTQEESR